MTIPVFSSISSDPKAIDLSQAYLNSSSKHLYGTDGLGRDLASRLSHVMIHQVLQLWFLVIVADILGFSVGVMVASSTKKFLWKPFVSLLNVISAVPLVISCFGFSLLLGHLSSHSYFIVMFIVFFSSCVHKVNELYRRDRSLGYWVAHQSFGGQIRARIFKYGCLGEWRQPLFHHIIFHMQIAVTVETAVSFLGFGVQEPDISFGNLLSHFFTKIIHGDYLLLIPILITFMAVIALPPYFAAMMRFRD